MLKGTYERTYKKLVMKYALLLLELKEYEKKELDLANFYYKKIYTSIFELAEEKKKSDDLYKSTKDTNVYKSNLYLLGIRLKDLQLSINEKKDEVNPKMYATIKDYIDFILYKIEKILFTKTERNANIF